MSVPRAEAGAATLLAVAMAGVLMMLGAALAVVGAMVLAHRQAQASADLAALAGAAAATHGDRAPATATGVDVAATRGSGIVSCDITTEDLCEDLREDTVHDGLGIGDADANVLVLGQRP